MNANLYAAADDMAEAAAAINAEFDCHKRAFIPQGCDQQGRLESSCPAEAASACTEIGADSPLSRDDQSFVVAVLGLMSLIWVVCIVWWAVS